MTPEQRAAALRLVDYIEHERINLRGWDAACRELAALVHELLAEPVQEPVAWMANYTDRDGQAAVYVTTHYDLAVENDANGKPTPLFAAPPQRQPLSDVRAIVQQAALALEDLTALLGAM